MVDVRRGRVAGKVALITGGGSGIGAATAILLAAEGASVAVADIIAERAEATAAAITANGGSAVPITADVSDEDQVEAMVDATLQSFGRLDILHNNAALVDPKLFPLDGRVVDMSVDVWDQVMAVNLRGPMLGCKHAIPRMVETGGGSIINMSSGSSRLGDLERSAYGASKAGVNALTLYVATQHGHENIRCNAILPGLVLTPAARDNLLPGLRQVLESNVLTQYVGEPDDVAYLVLYLGSDESKYITGQAFPVNGGMSSHQPTLAQRLAATDGP
jgi:NAD(P)-dependent dehydrogenase (short-subunit alcohol dehydrogenase family)